MWGAGYNSYPSCDAQDNCNIIVLIALFSELTYIRNTRLSGIFSLTVLDEPEVLSSPDSYHHGRPLSVFPHPLHYSPPGTHQDLHLPLHRMSTPVVIRIRHISHLPFIRDRGSQTPTQ